MAINVPGLAGFLQSRDRAAQEDETALKEALLVQGVRDKRQAVQQQSLDRQASMQQAGLDRQANRQIQAASLEERRMHNEQTINARYAEIGRQAANDAQRADLERRRLAEVAANNQRIDSIKRLIIDSRPQPQPQIIQTPNGPMQVNRNAQATPITGPDGQPLPPAAATERALPVGAAQKLFENQMNLRRAQRALALGEGKDVGTMKGDADATGWKGLIPDELLQRFDAQGVDTRAELADLGSLVIHERSGAAVTAAEFPRLKPFIPKVTDDGPTRQKKLARFAQIYQEIANETAEFYRGSGYKVPELKSLDTAPAAPAAPSSKFEEGKVYVDAKGNKARYQGGAFVPVK